MNQTQTQHKSGLALVVGATGKTGRRVASRLKQRGVPVRPGIPSASPPFDWSRQDTWAAVLEGVESAYVAYPQDLPIEAATERIGAFIDQARAFGVERMVLLTGRGEDDGLRQESMLRDSGMQWTVVRSAWFNQNFTEGGFAEMVRSGELALPADVAPEPFVDLDDLADVVTAALTEPGHAGQVYEVTGPRLLTFPELATMLSEGLGKPVAHVPLAHSDFLAGVAESGAPPEAVALMDFLFGELLDGRNAHLSNGVQRALGREPKDFSDFARQQRGAGHVGSVRRFVAEFINGGDESVLDELVHSDYVYRSPGEEVRGREGLAAMFRGYRSAFPDMALSIHDVLVDGDKTVLDFTLGGTHRGDFMGLPATGRPFQTRGVVISHFRGDKIAHEWEILDTMTILQQLGR